MTATIHVENAIKWCEALESGEYPQDSDSGGLRTTQGYCCLGVAEEIRGTTWKPAYTGSSYFTNSDGLTALPSMSFGTQFLGLDPLDPRNRGNDIWVKDPDGEYTTVSHLNDHWVPFPEIARRIRAEFDLPPAA